MTLGDVIAFILVWAVVGLICYGMVDAADREAEARRERVAKLTQQMEFVRGSR